jgi:hypothetical protein
MSNPVVVIRRPHRADGAVALTRNERERRLLRDRAAGLDA